MKMRGYTDQRHLYQIDSMHAWAHGRNFPPTLVEIDPSDMCNQKCHYCYNQHKVGRKQLSTDVLVRLVNQLANYGVKAVLYQGSGEPLMHKGLPDVIEQAWQKGLSQTVTTNGALFTPDIADRIMPKLHYMRFSVVDNKPERYCHWHGCSEKQWHMMDANLRYAVKFREYNHIEFYFIASVYLDETNFNDAYDIVSYYKDLGLDYIVIQEYVTGDHVNGWHLPSDQFSQEELNNLYRRVGALNDDNFSVKVRFPINDSTFVSGMLPDTYKPNFCEFPRFNTVITADGDVIPCWRGWGKPELSFGNVNELSFAEIWEGEQRKRIMEYINSTPPEGNECSVCNQWKGNRVLEGYRNRTKWSDFLI